MLNPVGECVFVWAKVGLVVETDLAEFRFSLVKTHPGILRCRW